MITHKLNIDPSIIPIQQRKIAFSEEKLQAMSVEVKKLLRAGVIKKIEYPTWLCNPILVKKANGVWRMCQDFTDLKKACPSFQLPLIDRLVDATAGHKVLCFLDEFFGYHQIRMHPADAHKTAFPDGIYFYDLSGQLVAPIKVKVLYTILRKMAGILKCSLMIWSLSPRRGQLF